MSQFSYTGSNQQASYILKELRRRQRSSQQEQVQAESPGEALCQCGSGIVASACNERRYSCG